VTCVALIFGCGGLVSVGPFEAPPPAVMPTPMEPSLPSGPLPPTAKACESGAEAVSRTPLRRLTKSQYRQTVSALLGAEVGPLTTSIPEDERVGTFRANAVLPVSEAHVRRFADAAEAVAQKGLVASTVKKWAPCFSSGAPDVACGDTFIREFGARAFRRPLTTAEFEGLQKVFQVGRDTGTFADALVLVAEAVFQAPQFLYHFETVGEGNTQALDSYAMSARLSYFLWGSLPDEQLWQAAKSDTVKTADQIQSHAKRLAADARADALLTDFVSEWLGIENLSTLVRDAKLFPQFGPTVSAAMREETVRFSTDVWRNGDGKVSTLLNADYSFVPDALFPVYGISKPFGYNPSMRLKLPNKERAGILTQPAFLTAHSFSDHTSPVKRGVFLLSAVLCNDIALPTGIAIPELPPPDPNQTTRERFTIHEKPGCAGCHIPIDNLGFAFENYDAIGGFRTTENGKAIDSRGALSLGNAASDGEANGGVEMVYKMLASQELKSCFVRQMTRFALRREAKMADMCALAKLRDGFEASGTDVRRLVADMASSQLFSSP
jgi:Protein of unknown function (DUF1592)/Protein of unknown function (DUF1588)/Protein of unknown function (DUF1595)/Protein of unknown function (DUF1587)/Protein of unknown function (DUF1585)